MEADRLAALRSEWEAGQSTEAMLSEKYLISTSRIRVLATKNGWVKRKPPEEAKVLAAVNLFSFDPNEQATLSAAQVISVHRKDVARLRDISGILVERLGLELAGLPMMDKEGNVLACRGTRESPADLLEKLSRVLVRTTEIERQAYGLKTFNPEAAATDAELQAELDKLTADVEEIARIKAEG